MECRSVAQWFGSGGGKKKAECGLPIVFRLSIVCFYFPRRRRFFSWRAGARGYRVFLPSFLEFGPAKVGSSGTVLRVAIVPTGL